MAEADRQFCRRAAAECIALARITGDSETKQTLLTRAQEWLKLAYAEHDAEFERLVDDFNAQQMGEPMLPGGPMQRQPMQQQQAKVKKKE